LVNNPYVTTSMEIRPAPPMPLVLSSPATAWATDVSVAYQE